MLGVCRLVAARDRTRRKPLPVRRRAFSACVAAGLILGGLLSSAAAADLNETASLLKSGKYAECVATAGEAIEKGEWSESWRLIKIRGEMALGRYADAAETLQAAMKRYPSSIQLRMLGADVLRYNGRTREADELVAEIEPLAKRMPLRYSDAGNRVALGRFLVSQRFDARQVLELVYDSVKKQHPDFVDVYVATAELALSKNDYAVAAESLTKALEYDDADPDIHYLLARAYAESDSEKATAALSKALALNSHHVESLLLSADKLIDGEQYDKAEEILERALDVNPREPRAWAYRAVLAHLQSDAEAEVAARYTALRDWRTNPEVDHLIGRKLSQNYRFAEGAEYQRKSLTAAPQYLPAKIQLAQDLLRLGEEDEGWQLAKEVNENDAYNVVAHNLITLQEHLDQFRTLQDNGLIVRMDAREAELYGARVLELLSRAKAELAARYEIEIDKPVIVEIFPRQEDFAIRTFGLPGGAGFLGVCFGRVITANSPASQAENPANWESVLWHEFCHVVTLSKTNNKMPRWLSEGISVYEELQEDPSWGQSMTPQYRQWILGDELTPVSRLSSAFLSPPTAAHLQFAYYESALVVEYLVERYGHATLLRILDDLGVGMPINDSLARYAGSLESLDSDFAEFAQNKARQVAPEADWERPEFSRRADADEIAAYLQNHPHNYWALQRYAALLIRQKQWEQAKQPLGRLLELYPGDTGEQNALAMLAAVHRQLGENQDELAVLNRLAELTSDSPDVYQRLVDLAVERQDWGEAARNARRLLAVNPLLPAAHRQLARAAQELGDEAEALRAYRAVLAAGPIDPADTHYQLARLAHKTGDSAAARRHVLLALEEAPRFRAAHKLLLEIVRPPDEPLTTSDDGSSPNGKSAPAESGPDEEQEKSP